MWPGSVDPHRGSGGWGAAHRVVPAIDFTGLPYSIKGQVVSTKQLGRRGGGRRDEAGGGTGQFVVGGGGGSMRSIQHRPHRGRVELPAIGQPRRVLLRRPRRRVPDGLHGVTAVHTPITL